MACRKIAALLQGPPRASWRRQWPAHGALGIVVILAAQAAAQPAQAPAVNPRTIQFDVSQDQLGDIVAFRVELFPRGTDTATAPPVSTLEVPKPRGRQAQLIVEIRELLSGVPDGEYVATVRSIGRRGESARSAPTEPFTVSGLADVPRRAPERRPESSPTPAPPPGPPEPESEREPWPWTLIGIAMGVAAFLVGFLVR